MPIATERKFRNQQRSFSLVVIAAPSVRAKPLSAQQSSLLFYGFCRPLSNAVASHSIGRPIQRATRDVLQQSTSGPRPGGRRHTRSRDYKNVLNHAAHPALSLLE